MTLNFKVKNTTILHNKKTYAEGDVIELEEIEAKRLEDFVELLPKQTTIKAQTQTQTTKTAAQNKTTNKTAVKNQTKTETNTETETKENKSSSGGVNDK